MPSITQADFDEWQAFKKGKAEKAMTEALKEPCQKFAALLASKCANTPYVKWTDSEKGLLDMAFRGYVSGMKQAYIDRLPKSEGISHDKGRP